MGSQIMFGAQLGLAVSVSAALCWDNMSVGRFLANPCAHRGVLRCECKWLYPRLPHILVPKNRAKTYTVLHISLTVIARHEIGGRVPSGTQAGVKLYFPGVLLEIKRNEPGQ